LRTECSKELRSSKKSSPTSSFQKLHREDTSLQLKMASLGDVQKETTIDKRRKILSQFLKENDVGKLSDENDEHFRLIFQKNYTLDEGDEKFKDEDIDRVEFDESTRGDKWFVIYHKYNSPQTAIPTSIKYLAGSKRSGSGNQNIARVAIQPQIDAFKKVNPLNVDDECPLGNCKLGSDAQVDHEISFKNF
jgi:hypothetical protein